MVEQTQTLVHLREGDIFPLFCLSSRHGDCCYFWVMNKRPPLDEEDVFYASPIAYVKNPGLYQCRVEQNDKVIFSKQVKGES